MIHVLIPRLQCLSAGLSSIPCLNNLSASLYFFFEIIDIAVTGEVDKFPVKIHQIKKL